MEDLISASRKLSDNALVLNVSRLTGEERHATAQLVAALGEFDVRRLYLPAGCSSLFTYCTRVLHLSEDAAYTRIEAARAVRQYPEILPCLLSGELTLTAVRLLAPCLTPANQAALLQRARHLSKREVEHLVAEQRPQPDVPATVRKVATCRRTATPLGMLAPDIDGHGGGSPAGLHGTAVGVPPKAVAPEDLTPAPAARAVVAPLAPERYKVQLTVSRETHDKLRRAQQLLRHVVPSGDLAGIVDRALTILIADLERRKAAAVKRPQEIVRPSIPRANDDESTQQRQAPGPSRHIPAAVRREVWRRDEGRCAYVGTAGRCDERGLLEFHHVVPYADGGAATAHNIELRCRNHNAFEAERRFGEHALPGVARKTAPA